MALLSARDVTPNQISWINIRDVFYGSHWHDRRSAQPDDACRRQYDCSLVFIYSIGYMAHEEGYWRYFAGLALFLFSMLGIVLANNFVMMFIFWELVGVSSYILIGHYYGGLRPRKRKQAFIVNRIGDFGLCWHSHIWHAAGRWSSARFCQGSVARMQSLYLNIACILVFCGAVKSAVAPHVWLPNSMEGPTRFPRCSMRRRWWRRGSIMLARVFPLLVGCADCQGRDRLGRRPHLSGGGAHGDSRTTSSASSYSTISQLGYMVLGAGVASVPDVPMFHLFTHAFFKCLLFLCAGSVIVALHHEQDIWQMGGLRGKTP